MLSKTRRCPECDYSWSRYINYRECPHCHVSVSDAEIRREVTRVRHLYIPLLCVAGAAWLLVLVWVIFLS